MNKDKLYCVDHVRFLNYFLNLFIYLFVYFWRSWVFVAANGGYFLVALCGLLFVVVPLVAEHTL